MEVAFETVVTSIESVAVAIIAIGLIVVTVTALYGLAVRHPSRRVYRRARGDFGRVLLLGLEVLIAADIVQTVTVELSIRSVGTLGLLVIVRTFLSWSIGLETEGHWPWQEPKPSAEA